MLSSEGLTLLLEFVRSEQGGDAFAFRFNRQSYLRRSPGGSFDSSEFPWDQSFVEELGAVRRPGRDPALVQRMGETLRAFLEPTGWARDEEEILGALKQQRPIILTIRSAAAELYALPWELLTLRSTGQHLGELPGVLLRYEWPETQTAPEVPAPRAEGGRIFFAWSAAAGAVPASEHLSAIQRACQSGLYAFDSQNDVLHHASCGSLHATLEAAERQGKPIAVLHLLCHGGAIGQTFGLAMNGESSDASAVVVDPGRLRQLLAPFVGMVRLVVLSACDSGNPGLMGNQLGSVAQTLHRAGFAAVVASRYPLSVSSSTRMTEAFYKGLLTEPASLEHAFLEARQHLCLDASTLDWASLQYYARASDESASRPVIFRPYRSLLAFHPEHRRFFFGRDSEIAAVVGTLRTLTEQNRPRFLVVAGASGTGKSSLVLGGAAPQILSAAGVRLASLRPGSEPDAALAAALPENAGSEKCLLIVDQFEEIFTHTLHPAARTRFVQRLWRLASAPAAGVSVILTVRVDFIGRCGELLLEADGRRLDSIAYDAAHGIFVAQMGPAELRAAILEPARKVGLLLEEGLASRMLTDVGAEPGALPLLEYTLDLLWQRRDGRTLTQAAYDAVGGVTGALHSHADKLFAGLDPVEQQAARGLLVQLVSLGDDAAMATRRRVSIASVRPSGQVELKRFERVLSLLVDERLLVRDGTGSAQTVEVAHEALIRKWPRVIAWVREERDRLRRKKERQQRMLLSGAALLALIFAGLASLAYVKQRQVQAQQQALRQQLLASYVEQGRQYLLERGDPMRALLWLNRAYQEDSASPTLRFLLAQALISLDAQKQELPARTAAIRPDGAQVATATTDGDVKLWDTQSGSLLHTLAGTKDARVLAFSRDNARFMAAMPGSTEIFDAATGQRVAAFPGLYYFPTLGPDGTLLFSRHGKNTDVWEVATGKLLRSLPGQVSDSRDGDSFSRDGKWVFLSESEHGSRAWNLLTGDSGPPLPYLMKFSPEGSKYVRWTGSLTLVVWGLEGGERPLFSQGQVNTLAWSRDGRRVLTATFDGESRVWDAQTGELFQPLGRHGDVVEMAAFSPDNHLVVTASRDQTAKLWDVNTGSLLLTLVGHHGAVSTIAFSPNGNRLITIGDDHTVRLWDAKAWQLHDGKQIAKQDENRKGMAINLTQDKQAIRVLSWIGNQEEVWDEKTGRLFLALCTGDEATVKSLFQEPQSAELLSSFKTRSSRVRNIAFSSDEARLLIDGDAGTAKVWNTRTWKLLYALQDVIGQAYHVDYASFSSDGAWLQVRGRSMADIDLLNVWDAETGQLLLARRGDTARMSGWELPLKTPSKDTVQALLKRVPLRLNGEALVSSQETVLSDHELIRKVIKHHINEVKDCYEAELTRNPKLAGRLLVQIQIGAAGQVTDSAVLSSTLNNADVENCIAARVRRWEFHKPASGSISFGYPFVLKPAD